MKKLLFGAALFSILSVMGSCGGKNERQQEENVEVQKFAESFAQFVKANQIDSIKAVYPTANFDSVASMPLDSISITTNEDGSFKINFTSDKWIEVKEGEAGKMQVTNSKGIAAFPEDKVQLAMNTGMLKLDDNDIKSQELLNDSTYFAWLEKNNDNGDYVIKIKPGKFKNVWKPNWGEGSKGTITVTLTNLSDSPVSGSDYFITYKTYESNGYTDNSRRNYTKNNKHKGIDLRPKGSGTINLSQWETYKFYDFKIKPAEGKESVLKYQYKPTGKEYQEYLDSKK